MEIDFVSEDGLAGQEGLRPREVGVAEILVRGTLRGVVGIVASVVFPALDG